MLGRGAPVDVAAVVSGLVLAQGVEGKVRHRQVRGHLALEVAQQPRSQALQRDRPRVHDELGALGPGDGAADQPERVAVHRRRRAHRHHAAVRGRDDEQLLVGPAGAQHGQGEPRGGASDRQLEQEREHPPPRDVLDGDPSGRGLPHGDPARLDVGGDPQPGAAGGQQHAGQDEDQAAGGDHRQLDPGEARRHPPREEPDAQDGPPERADPPEDLDHGMPHRARLLRDRSDPAPGEDEDARAGVGQGARDLDPREGDGPGAAVGDAADHAADGDPHPAKAAHPRQAHPGTAPGPARSTAARPVGRVPGLRARHVAGTRARRVAAPARGRGRGEVRATDRRLGVLGEPGLLAHVGTRSVGGATSARTWSMT